MTDRDTASLLREALQRRAEYGMQTTNTERELHRLREQMAPVRRRRQLRAALAIAAVVAVVGGGIGLAVALTHDNESRTSVVAPRPTSTTLPAGTLPTGFPLGTYSHPGSAGLTTMQITRHASAYVGDPRGRARNFLTFTTPDIVTFDTRGYAGCSQPGRYRWAVANDELVLTAIADECSERRIALTEKPWGPVKRTQS